jgi:transposase
MTKPLSNDLRERLISAVAGGMSRRAAAERYGVVPSTAINWVRRWRESGTHEPRPQGGDHRSERIEAFSEDILRLVVENIDITLAEIAAHLEQHRGERFAPSTVWRFLDRRDITYKKNRPRQRTGTPGRGRSKTGMARGAAGP